MGDGLPAGLLKDIRALIEEARQQTAAAVNVGLTLLYWRVGRRIHTEVLGNERAVYGEQIVATLSRQLVAEYGRGFAEKNLRRMMQFAQAYPDEKIVATLLRQLSWSHFLALIPLDKPLQRDFYAEMCRIERWSVRTLRERIGSMLYERTALSKKPDELIEQELAVLRTTGDLSPPFVLKDPYVLDFLGLQDRYLEKDLEDAILRELENVILELGTGFSFIARQKRIQLDSDDFYIDLLFYTANLNAWSPSTSSWATSKPNTKARWSYTCAGWIATSVKLANRHRLASSSAPAKSRSRSNCLSWTRPASMWPNTSLFCRPAKNSNNVSIWRSRNRG